MARELLHPGVYSFEEAGAQRPPQIGTSTGAFVGVAERGEANKPYLLFGLGDYVRRLGGPLSSSYGYDSVDAFFRAGGRRCYFSRVVGAGAVKASAALKAHESVALQAVTLTHKGSGAFGNNFTLRTDSVRTTLTATLVAGATTTATLTDASAVVVGKPLIIEDLVNRINVVVATVNPTTGVITFPSVVVAVGGILAASSVVRSAATHRLRTELAEALVTGATKVKVQSTVSARAGQRLLVTDGTTIGTAVVQAVNGNELIFTAAIVLTATIPTGTKIVSIEWDLLLFEAGNLVGSHQFMSSEATNNADYFVNRLRAESELLDAVDDAPVVTVPYLKLPEPYLSLQFSGGVEGAAPLDADFIGTTLLSTGLHAYDKFTDVNMLSVPGVTTQAVQQAGVDYAEARKDLCFLVDLPLAADTPTEMRDFRLNTLARDSSFYAMYGTWPKVDSPITPGILRSIPPSGPAQGAWSFVAADRGVHKAPANIVVPGALDLERDVSDSEQDVLNPIGINVLRKFPSRGIVIWGARTGSNLQDGRQYIPIRRVLIFVRRSLEEAFKPLLFEPINTSLYARLKMIGDSFLTGLWETGMLFPEDDITKAFFVKVDEENNTPNDRAGGRVNVDVGIQPPPPAEFIVLRTMLFDGGARFEEIIGGLA